MVGANTGMFVIYTYYMYLYVPHRESPPFIVTAYAVPAIPHACAPSNTTTERRGRGV
jgi:hypothetical protein